MKRTFLTILCALPLAASAQNLVVAATNLPGPGYVAWTNFVARYNQAAGTNTNVNVPGFHYWQTNITAAVTNDAGEVVAPGTTNVVEIHPQMTSAALLAEFAKSDEFKRLCGEALEKWILARKSEIWAKIEENWWNGIK